LTRREELARVSSCVRCVRRRVRARIDAFKLAWRRALRFASASSERAASFAWKSRGKHGALGARAELDRARFRDERWAPLALVGVRDEAQALVVFRARSTRGSRAPRIRA